MTQEPIGWREYLDAKLDPMATDIRELKDRVGAQNGRIGRLENWRSWITGGVAFMSILTAVVAFAVGVQQLFGGT